MNARAKYQSAEFKHIIFIDFTPSTVLGNWFVKL